MKRDPKDVLAKRQRLLQRLAELKAERQSWMASWQELFDHIRPSAFRNSMNSTDVNRGERKDSKIVNNTPTWAARTLAAGMMSGITSPSRPWFRLTTPDPSLAESQGVKEWLSQVEDRLKQAMAKSNFYKALHLVYEDLSVAGVSALLIEEDLEDGVRAYVFPVGQYVLANSDRLAINTVMREFKMTVTQMVTKFGKEACSESVQRMYDNNQRQVWIDVVHVIEPNEDYVEGKLGYRGKKFYSCWLEQGGMSGQVGASPDTAYGLTSGGILRESGYVEFPVMAPRWVATGEDVYCAASPAMEAIGDIKALMILEKRKLQAFDKVVNPPMVGPSALEGKRASILPGDMTYSDSMSPSSMFRPAIVVDVRAVEIAGAEVQRYERRIERSFFADLWLMLQQQDGQMTATEVSERREEKLLQLGSVLEGLQDELLDPAIDRIFGIEFRAGRIPPAPQELQGQPLKVEYISIMAQAQKLIGTTAVERLTNFVLAAARSSPNMLDKLDTDEIIDGYAAMLGVPPSMIRTDDAVQALRQARAQMQQQQQAMQAAHAGAQTAKTLSQADTEGDNGLTTMLRGLGAA